MVANVGHRKALKDWLDVLYEPGLELPAARSTVEARRGNSGCDGNAFGVGKPVLQGL